MVFVVLFCGVWLIVFVNVMLLWNHSPSAGTECSCSSRTSPPTSRVITSAAHNQFLLERGVVSVLRLAGRLLGRGDFPVIEVSK